MTLTPINSGWIEVICGSMFSGKTEELIRRLRRAQIAKMSIAIFKPQIDSRYDKGHIVSHNKMKMISFVISDPKEIIARSKEHEVIGIDETQFFDHSFYLFVLLYLDRKSLNLLILILLDLDLEQKI